MFSVRRSDSPKLRQIQEKGEQRGNERERMENEAVKEEGGPVRISPRARITGLRLWLGCQVLFELLERNLKWLSQH